ncbi:MAG: tetratricopeptide repeat protein [Bryobacteraceae bacterium]
MPLICAGPDWLPQVLRGMSPDLWSVVTLMIRLEPEPIAPDAVKRPDKHQEHGDRPKAWNIGLSLDAVEGLRGKAGREAKLAESLMRAAEGNLAKGDPGEALRLYTDARAAPEGDRGDREAMGVLWRVDIALGAVRLARADTGAARESYGEACEVAAHQLTLRAGDAEWLRNAAVSHERLGDLHRSLGEVEPAAASYQRAIELGRELVRREAGRGERLRDLAVSYDRMGDLYRSAGQHERAQGFYEKALDIARKLVAGSPSRVDWMRDLSVTYNKLGDLQRDMGLGDAAREFYQKALDVRLELVKQGPGRADALVDLAVSYERMSALYTALEHAEFAREFRLKAEEARGKAAALDGDSGALRGSQR